MQREVNKLLKQLNVEKLKKNHKECVELYNIIGGLYSEVGQYDEATHYHEQALELAKTLGDRLKTAVTFRFIGEAKAAEGNFFQAIEAIKKYQELAQKTSDSVEIQRAWTTLGRVYLIQAQDLKENNVDKKRIRETAREAEKRFQTALQLAEALRNDVDKKEFAQMKAGLLLNLGSIKDLCGQHDEAIIKINRAIEICKCARLKDDLYRCQIILASLYRHNNYIKNAVKLSEDALQTAKSIGKKLLIVDALLELGQVRMCQRDFKSAKKTFAQAYLERSPSEDDHAKAIRYTKLSHLILNAFETIIKDNTPGETRLKLCDKLGDLFVAMEQFKLAIEYYRLAFSDARVCSKPKSELARILYSLAETYADDGQYQHALICYEKELRHRDENKAEQCHTMIKIAQMKEKLELESEKVCESYEKAYEKADKVPKLMYSVLKDYVPYLKQNCLKHSRCKELEEILLNLKSFPEVLEEQEENGYEEANDLEDEIANVDDIITDDEDNDEVLMIGRRRARGGATKFKANEVGDTPLHEASIKGDLKRVKSLINQGHEVNPRDNAGWIPLHEACNHGHLEVAQYLVNHGADVNRRGLSGMSPLHDAAQNGHYDIMRLLIKNGANVIALTDNGQTVLSCLREFRKLNQSTMSNSNLSEHRQMECELLNIMDKCGYNLMAESMRSLGKNSSSASSSRGPIREEPATTSVRPKTLMHGLERDPISKPVKDYRETISTLKRRRLHEEEPVKKPSQPATYCTTLSTSAPTKEWFIDDVSRQHQIRRRRSNTIHEILELDEEEEVKETSENIDDDEVMVVDDDESPEPPKSTNQSHKLQKQQEPPTQPRRIQSPVLRVLNSPNSLDSESLPEFTPSPEPVSNLSNNPTGADMNSKSRASSDWWDDMSSNQISTKRSSFDLFGQPLVVTMGERKLLVPIKDQYTTIGELKKSIVDRYSLLVDAEPKISLAPISDPACILFDNDLCKDVIRENVVATIDLWLLPTIEESYVNNCAKYRLQPVNFVKCEMRALDETNTKLHLAYMKFPKSHLKPIVASLARRDFTSADLTGFVTLFEWGNRVAQEFLDTIGTWNRLARMSLRCVGLTRSQFESICHSKCKLSELVSLDVSVNSIVYKNKSEFVKHLESLRETCVKLKRLDVRRNYLLFVKSIIGASATSSSSTPIPGGVEETKLAPNAEAATKATATFLRERESLDLAEALNMVDMEILGSDQSEHTLY